METIFLNLVNKGSIEMKLPEIDLEINENKKTRNKQQHPMRKN